ncbi:MAG: PaaI family thioesterase [Clostridium sp.]|nr:PaaI family thioesterase [Clostridium sp.]
MTLQTGLFQKVIDERDGGNIFGRMIGIRTLEVRNGYCTMEMPVIPQLLNPIGSLHGGCLYTIADCAAGGAAWSYGERMTTVSSDFHFLRPGIGVKTVYAEGHVIKHGKKITVVDVKVTDQDGKELCAGLFSYTGIGIPVETDS